MFSQIYNWFKSKNPPCSQWNVWIGDEVEGTISLGVKTIFVRDLKHSSLEKLKQQFPGINRIWFCDEFRDWVEVEKALNLYESVCVTFEVSKMSYLDFCKIPKTILKRVKVYWRSTFPVWVIDFAVNNGSQICLGEPYELLTFSAPYGRRVYGEDYGKDVKVL
jgi:hypothetical protein